MEFNLESFVNRLRQVIYDNFPTGPEPDVNPSGSPKHPNAPLHIKDVAFMDLPMSISDNQITFDIGSAESEAKYPYYHILEDTQLIKVRGRSTKTSRGSQIKLTDEQLKAKRRGLPESKYTTVSERAARDFGKVNWNGKTFTQEYRKNVRGVRSKIGSLKKYIVDSDGQVFIANEKATTYFNIHYHYIERILDAELPYIAGDFNLKQLKVQDTGLQEEWNMHQQSDMGFVSSMNILDIINSFRED